MSGLPADDFVYVQYPFVLRGDFLATENAGGYGLGPGLDIMVAFSRHGFLTSPRS